MKLLTSLTFIVLISTTAVSVSAGTKTDGKADPWKDRSYGKSAVPDDHEHMDRRRTGLWHCDISPTTSMCRDRESRYGPRSRHCDVNPNTPLCRGE
jgi:hypothetical protein